ncbi:hypothetical protein OAS39_09175 [Pirellulales bacterium]|nr:hypothetical protein [Pirellulales bacterium]
MANLQKDRWELLREHLDGHPDLSQLSGVTRDALVSWLRSAGPFRDPADMQARLKKQKIKGLNKQARQAFVQSLAHRLPRRSLLAAMGIASVASLAMGVRGLTTADANAAGNVPESLRPLLAALQRQGATIGRAVVQLARSPGRPAAKSDSMHLEWAHFSHALDMSNWLEAAQHLGNPAFDATVSSTTRDTDISGLIDALRRLRSAWDYLLATRGEWEKTHFIAYALGKMPALSAPNSEVSAIPDYDVEAEAHATAIHEMAPLFHALEIFNQRFQLSGQTKRKAPVRCTQGHNFSYAHLAEDLRNRQLFPEGQPKILVNWDAHADLSGPFENPRVPTESPFQSLMGASRFGERVVVASSMSIAGWILPLMYQGVFESSNQKATVFWVVPREAQQTSKHYMESYGEYEFFVGDWPVPQSADEMKQQSTTSLGDWNVPGSTEIRKYSAQSSLRSVVAPELLKNQRKCTLHIVDPDDLASWSDLLSEAQIALSIDADFAGTREPGLSPRKGFLPHYPLTGSKQEKARHEELIARLEQFVTQYAEQIGAVSIANSPNFTVGEATRKPVAKILEILVGDRIAAQPDWVGGEIAREAPNSSGADSDLLNLALSAGGATGLALTASLLLRQRSRMQKLHSLLFSTE